LFSARAAETASVAIVAAIPAIAVKHAEMRCLRSIEPALQASFSKYADRRI
jgi:hypothetical protein